jgi:hypothetical protein
MVLRTPFGKIGGLPHNIVPFLFFGVFFTRENTR